MYTPKEFPRLDGAERIAFDCEGTGLYYPRDHLFGISIAVPGWGSAYWDVRRQPEVKRWWNDQMKRFKGHLYAHNAHFDAKMWYGAKMDLPLDQTRCTMIQACLINEHEFEFGLDYLSKKYLKREKVGDVYAQLAAMFGGPATRSAQILNLQKAPPELVDPYAVVDAELVLDLSYWQDAEIEKQGIQEIVEFEAMIFPTIQEMTRWGVRVDLNRAEDAQKDLGAIIDTDQKKLNDIVGFDINVNSSAQIKKIFDPQKQGRVWVANNGYQVEETAKGGPSIPSPVLREMTNDPRAQLIVDIRSNIKTRDTFLGGHVIGHAVDERVYPTINQAKGEDGGTGTGRLSYVDPALQQVSARNKRVSKIVKGCFLPEMDEDWESFDLASQEVRIFAHLTKNEHIIKQYRDNPLSDFHQLVADMMGIVRNATYSGQVNSKQLNLSMIFNSGNGAIAEKLGLPFSWETFQSRGETVTYKKAGSEAMSAINLYHEKVPGVKDLADRAKKVAEQRGWVRTQYGRRLRFPRGYKSYKASGLIIQATSADVTKHALHLLYQEAKKSEMGRLLLTCHDSYECSVVKGKNKQFAEMMQDIVSTSFPWLRVPLVLDCNGYGDSYFNASNGQFTI